MNRKTLLEELSLYKTDFEEESAYIPRFKLLLGEELCFSRELTTGHFTASAWILNQHKDAVLMMHHKKLNRWLQPGGHADNNEDLVKIATKEAREETGLLDLKRSNDQIFDLDIHLIPERKHIPEHYHYDVRFLFMADENEPIVQNHESNEVKWVKLVDLESLVDFEQSIIRMKHKIKLTFDH
ncbi:MAG: NUDIX hydrolase [Reichenbachiella sp.]